MSRPHARLKATQSREEEAPYGLAFKARHAPSPNRANGRGWRSLRLRGREGPVRPRTEAATGQGTLTLKVGMAGDSGSCEMGMDGGCKKSGSCGLAKGPVERPS